MATVYLAIQESFEREVALKVMSPALSADPAFGERFIREARIVSRLVHPNIVTVYDVGVHEGHHFLSMEYIPGQDLKHKRLELTRMECLQVIKDIAKALDFAGKKGYVHRDVKPENIMLHEEDGRSVLMDFGIARPAGAETGMTQTGMAIGTPHYMSPEQAKGKAVDSRSDIYSLGVVLYLLLTGQVPYKGDSAVAVGVKHVSEPVPRLPGSLKIFQTVIDKFLAKDVKDRYQSGAEVIAALDQMTTEDLAVIERLEKKQLKQGLGAASNDAPTLINASVSSERKAGVLPPGERKQNIEQIVADPEHSSDVIPESEYHSANSHFSEPRASWWPWLAGGIVALSVTGGVLYEQYYPGGLTQLVNPEIELVEKMDAPKVSAFLESDDLSVSQVTSSEKSVAHEAETSITASLELQETESQSVEPKNQSIVLLEQNSPFPPVSANSAIPKNDPENQSATLTGTSDDAAASSVISVADDVITTVQISEEFEPSDSSAEKVVQNKKLETSSDFSSEATGSLTDVTSNLEDQNTADVRIQALLNDGYRYLDEDALTSPKGANAFEVFQEVLTLDHNHDEAKKAITKISERYQVLAEELLANGKMNKALLLADRGLMVLPENGKLKQIQQKIKAKIQQENKIRTYLTQANSLLALNQLLKPRKENAFYYFQKALELDNGNHKAEEGLALVESRVFTTINNLINGNKLDKARFALNEAREKLPQSESLLRLQVKLDAAYEARLQAERPRISKVLVKGNAISSLNEQQSRKLQADRTVYIGIRYENFDSTTSILQAILYDGARSLQIAQVPVIIMGSKGVHYFRIDRPVEGFTNGGYNIDLILGKEKLISLTFNVENQSSHQGNH